MKAAGTKTIFLGATALLGSMLLTAIVVLVAQSSKATDFSQIRLAMFYWLAAGVPLASVVLAAAAGAGAARAQAGPGYGRLLGAAGAVLTAALVLTLGGLALSGFELPEIAARGFIGDNLEYYVPALFYLVLHSFAIGYAAKSVPAGVLLSAASLGAAAAPLFGIFSFQERYFELVPLGLLGVFSAAAGFGGPLVALKLLSAGARRSVAALLLALPALLGIGGIAALHLRAHGMTSFAEYPYYANYPSAPYILGDAMLVRRPYTGEIFLIDSSGRRAEVARGSLFPKAGSIIPELDDDNVMAARGGDGALWLLQYPSSAAARLLKGGIEGFAEQAVIPFQDGFAVRLQGGLKPGLVRPSYADGDYLSALPYHGEKLEWKKACESGPGCDYEGKKRKEEIPQAFLKEGTLVYGKQRWPVPGGLKNYKSEPFYGYHVKDGAAFFVPAKSKSGYFTYFCRTGAAPQPAWPEYMHNGALLPWPNYSGKIWTTPGGAVWWRARDQQAGEWTPVFLIANEEGKVLPPVRLVGAMPAQAGVDKWNSVLLRASGDTLWFNLDGKYMARVSAGSPGNFKLWKFPEIGARKALLGGNHDSDYALAVRAISGGAMIAGLDGVFFMDWAGNIKQLY